MFAHDFCQFMEYNTIMLDWNEGRDEDPIYSSTRRFADNDNITASKQKSLETIQTCSHITPSYWLRLFIMMHAYRLILYQQSLSGTHPWNNKTLLEPCHERSEMSYQ